MTKSWTKAARGRSVFVVFLFIMAMTTGSLFAVWRVMNDEDDIMRHQFYPYQRLIEQNAKKRHIDPALVAAVMRAESKFKPKAVSSRGAIGLMQLMPETGRWIAGELEDKGFSMEKLKEPELNVRYGTWYLDVLLNEFEGNEVLALAAYNAGHGNVHEWMEEYGWKMDFAKTEAIPFPETKKYVEKVLKYRTQYARLYHKE